MKNLNYFNTSFLILLLACVSFSCTSGEYETSSFASTIKAQGDVTTVNLDLPSFHSIKLNNSADVYITQGDQQSVKIEGQENVIEVLNKEVKDGVWSIRNTQNVRKAKRMKVYITIPTVELIHINGSGNLKSQNTFKDLKDVALGVAGSGNLDFDFEGKDLKCSVSGSGSMNLSLVASEIEGAIGGSGNIKISGSADTYNGKISGSGSMVCDKLDVEVANIKIAGSGDCKIGVSDLLTAKVSGSGSVYYRGNPKVESKTAGSGRVRAMGG